MKTLKRTATLIDVAFCAIVLPVMMMIFPVERWFHNFPHYVTLVGIWLYALYGINRGVTVPLLFRGRKGHYGAAAMIAASFIITFLLSSVELYTPKPNLHDHGITRVLPRIQQYQQAVWSLFMIVETFSFAVGMLTHIEIQRARQRKAEEQRDKAEIELYKARIKPHFMFNTLNSLYGLFLTGNEKALTSLEKFISMLRYIHTSASRDMVRLEEEADYIRQFVDIQSLRLNGKTSVTLDTDISHNGLMVPPMLLVTYVENCFKHGVSPEEESSITIRLHEEGGRLRFSTYNRIFHAPHIGEHIGIDNCRKRLALLYPHRHRIDISDKDGFFKVELSIDLS